MRKQKSTKQKKKNEEEEEEEEEKKLLICFFTIDATTGFFADRVRTARHTRSLASASPPGESTRITTAETRGSLPRSSRVLHSGAAVICPSPPAEPPTIAPDARTTAMRFLDVTRPKAVGETKAYFFRSTVRSGSFFSFFF